MQLPPGTSREDPSPSDPSVQSAMDSNTRSYTPPPPTYSPVTPELQPSFPATASSPAANQPYWSNPSLSDDVVESLALSAAEEARAANVASHAHPQNPLQKLPPTHPYPYDKSPPRRLRLKPPAPRPDPLPYVEELDIIEEPSEDVMALNAAIFLLQMQRKTAVQDLQKLQKQKTEAVQDIEKFADGLAKGSVKMRDGGVVASNPNAGSGLGDHQEDGGNEGGEGEGMQMEIPSAQKVVRMPKVEWAKYHVAGGALDKMHEGEKTVDVAKELDPFVDHPDEFPSEIGMANSEENGKTTSGGDGGDNFG